MTKEEKLLAALSEIDEELIFEAEQPYKPFKELISRLGKFAAVLALATVIAFGVRFALDPFIHNSGSSGQDNSPPPDHETEDGGTDGSEQKPPEEDNEDTKENGTEKK